MSFVRPEPEEVPEAHKLIQETVNECQDIIDISNLTVCTGGNSFNWVAERGGAVGEAKDGKTIELTFNTEIKSWRETLEKSVCFAYGQAAYININDSTDYRWQKLLSIVLGQKFSYEIHDSQPEREKLNQEFEKVAEDLKEEVADWNDKFFEQGDEYPPQFGYMLARNIVEKLEIQQIIKMEKDEILKQVEKILESEKQ